MSKNKFEMSLEELIKLAEEGSAIHQYELAKRYYNDKDYDRSFMWVSKAYENGYKKACSLLGVHYLMEKGTGFDPSKGKDLVTMGIGYEAEHSDYILGVCHEHGMGFKKDLRRALKFYEIGASKGDVEAKYQFGRLLVSIAELDDEIKQGLAYIEEAANEGSIKAEYDLAERYRLGYDVKRDEKKAYHFYELAANQGHGLSQYKAANHYYYGYYEGNELVRDVDKAMNFYILAASQNVVDAQLALGYIYLEKLGDIDKGIEYFTDAANQKDVEAIRKLIWHYEKEFKKTGNIADYFYWLVRGSDNDMKDAQFTLGQLYESRIVTDESYEIRSVYYYTLAAQNGNSAAMVKLADYFLRTGTTRKEIQMGIKYALEASKHGNTDGDYYLGNCYFEGIEMEVDYKKAFNHYHKAAINGHWLARLKVIECYERGLGVYADEFSANYWRNEYKRSDFEDIDEEEEEEDDYDGDDYEEEATKRSLAQLEPYRLG